MIKVLFVCLGNICRSPMAEAMFAHAVKQAGLTEKISWDSAGTSDYHPGAPPDERTLKTLSAHGIETEQKARQIQADDFVSFDYILAMDHKNLESLLEQSESLDHSTAKIYLIDSFNSERDVNDTPEDIPDPYWSEQDGFEEVYQLLLASCQNLMETIVEEDLNTAETVEA